MGKVCYRKLGRYKYQLMAPYALDVGIREMTIETEYLRLTAEGMLTIREAYAWDGPSGPTLDTPDFMRGSLVHDALYQLIRLRKLPRRYKAYADLLLKKICLEDGMCHFRAAYVYQAVRLFGGSSVRPGSDKPIVKICVGKG